MWLFTPCRVDAMLRALDMPTTAVFARPNLFGLSCTAQGCGALERKLRLSGIEVENVRFHMKGGKRVKMLLGERVFALEQHLGIVGWIGSVEKGRIAVVGREMKKLLAAEGITVNIFTRK